MNKWVTSSFFLIMFLHTSCAGRISGKSVENTITTDPPTIIPIPTQTHTKTSPPSPTPYPPLPAKGPYLLYRDLLLREGLFIIIGVDGHGRRLVEIPKDGYVRDLQKAVSPNGEWIAFHSGSLDVPFDLTLNLMNISDGTIVKISPVLSSDFPNNLPQHEEIYEVLISEGMNPTWWKNTILSNFRYGIESLAWSVDGTKLAFAGQIDGPSSDIYLYDLESKSIQRISNSQYPINHIEWSPDGSWILYEDSIPWGYYSQINLYVINPYLDVKEDRYPVDISGAFWEGEGWLTDNYYILYGGSDGVGPFDLRYLNIETQQEKMLWPDLFYDYAYDPENEIMVLSNDPYIVTSPDPFADPGLHFVDLKGNHHQISDEIFERLEFRGGKNSRFIGFNENNIVSIAIDGSIIPLKEGINYDYWMSVSPDQRWLVLYNYTGLDLYSEVDEHVRTISNLNVESVLWRPDSLGLFLIVPDKLYYLSVPEGDLILVYPQSGSARLWKGATVWLP